MHNSLISPNGVKKNKISLKGVIIGSIIATVATSMREILLLAYEFLPHDLDPMTDDQLSAMISGDLNRNAVLFSAWMLWGALCAILGGYVGARIAGRHEILNGALASFLSVGGGVYTLLFAKLYAPAWQHAATIVTGLALSALGGYIRFRIRTGSVAA